MIRLSRNSITVQAERASAFTWTATIKYLPLAFAGGFFAFSFAWIELGPLDWQIRNSGMLYFFLIGNLIALCVGYMLAVRNRPLGVSRGKVISVDFLVYLSCAAYLALYFPTVQAATGGVVPNVLRGLFDSGNAYAAAKYAESQGPYISSYLSFILAPLTLLFIPLTIFMFNRLAKFARILGAICIVLELSLAISMGISKGVAEIFAYVAMFLLILAIAYLRNRNWKRSALALIGIILCAGIFGGYYATIMTNRVRADSIENFSPSSDLTTKEKIDSEFRKLATLNTATYRDSHIIFQLPETVRNPVLLASTYVTHGYKGLAMAMEENWTPTWGMGFSDFIRNNIAKISALNISKDEIYSKTYMGKLVDRGWPSGLLWSTIFTAYASDVSFPGTIFVTFIVGFILGLSWKDFCLKSDPLAISVFFYVSMSIFYFSANNQLFQGGKLTIGFSAITFVWLVLRFTLKGKKLNGRMEKSKYPFTVRA